MIDFKYYDQDMTLRHSLEETLLMFYLYSKYKKYVVKMLERKS